MVVTPNKAKGYPTLLLGLHRLPADAQPRPDRRWGKVLEQESY